MDSFYMLKDAWQVQKEKKQNNFITSLRVEDRIVAVKKKVLNNGETFLILKRASYQGILKDMAKTYSNFLSAKNLVHLEILYYTPHLKEMLQHCTNLQDLSITDAEVDKELVHFILQSPLTNSCTFNRCKFDVDALDAFFGCYFRKTLCRNWFLDSGKSDTDGDDDDCMPDSVDLSEFEAQSFPGRNWIHFILRITDGKRMGTTQLSVLNCTFVKRIRILKNLHPDPLRALRQVIQDIRHVISSETPWDDYRSEWDMSPVEAVSNPFDSSSTHGMNDSLEQGGYL